MKKAFFLKKSTGCIGYADDLDRFINGEIGFEEIQGFIHEDVPIEEAIRLALYKSWVYPQEEHDLYEKLCYASVLRLVSRISTHSLYSEYLVAKKLCAPHKLDWNCLLRKIRREANIDKYAMLCGQNLYERYASGFSSSWYSDDDSD